MKNLGQKDMLFVTLTLEVEGLLWTGNIKLSTKLKDKGFSSFYTL